MAFSLVSLIGTLYLLYLLARFALWAYRCFFYRSNFSSYCPKETWAVVTGCTDGIGKGFVYELAKKSQLNLVLVSRSEDKLKQLAEEIQNNYKVSTKVVAIDFTTNYDLSKLKDELEGLDVSCLINNVGVNSEMPTKFLDLSDKEIKDMVQVNISSTLDITRLVLPKIVASKRGAIVNLSSYTGVLPTPLLGVYSATKSFIDSWSKTLKAEYGSSNIEIISVTPFYVVSAMSGFKKPSLTVCTPTRLAGDVIKAVGGAPSSISGYYVHSIMQLLIGLLPEFLYNRIAGSQMESVRKHYLKKKTAAAQAN